MMKAKGSAKVNWPVVVSPRGGLPGPCTHLAVSARHSCVLEVLKLGTHLSPLIQPALQA